MAEIKNRQLFVLVNVEVSLFRYLVAGQCLHRKIMFVILGDNLILIK